MSTLLVARYAAPAKNAPEIDSGLSIATLGALVTGYKLVESLLEPQVGLAIDLSGRTSRRGLMLTSAACSTGSLLVLFHPTWFPPHLSQFVCITVLLLVFAVAFATFLVCHSALVMDAARPGRERIRVSHGVAICAFFGMCLGLVLAPTAADHFGYGPMSTGVAALAFVCMVASSVWLPPGRTIERATEVVPTGFAVRSALGILRNSWFTRLTVSRACAGLCTNITALTIPLMLKSNGRPLSDAGLLFGCILLACVTGHQTSPPFWARNVTPLMGPLRCSSRSRSVARGIA